MGRIKGMADGFEGDWRDEVLVEDGAAEDGECDEARHRGEGRGRRENHEWRDQQINSVARHPTSATGHSIFDHFNYDYDSN